MTTNKKTTNTQHDDKKVVKPVELKEIQIEEPYNHDAYKGSLDEHNLEHDKTEVFDDIDMASNLAIGYAEQAWRNHRQKMSKKMVHPDFDGVHCIDCEIDIPQLRLNMGADRCTECQEMEDKRNSRR